MIHRDHFVNSRPSKSRFYKELGSKRVDTQLGLALCRGIAATSLQSCGLPSRNKEQELHPEDWAMLHSHEGLELASEVESVPKTCKTLGRICAWLQRYSSYFVPEF